MPPKWLQRRLALLTRRPTPRAWGETMLVAGSFALVAYPLAGWADLIAALRWPGLGSALLLFARVFVTPALTEELLFRGLLNPPPGWALRRARLGWGAASLALYVGAHPLSAYLFRPDALAAFTSPTFLLLTALLGLLCLVLYVRSGSLWTAVAFHATVVTAWALWGGLERISLSGT